MKTVKKVGPPTGGFGVKMVKKVGPSRGGFEGVWVENGQKGRTPPMGGLEGVWGENGQKGRTPLRAVLKGFGVITVKKVGPPYGWF